MNHMHKALSKFSVTPPPLATKPQANWPLLPLCTQPWICPWSNILHTTGPGNIGPENWMTDAASLETAPTRLRADVHTLYTVRLSAFRQLESSPGDLSTVWASRRRDKRSECCLSVLSGAWCVVSVPAQVNGCCIPAQVNGCCICPQVNGCCIPVQVNGCCILAQVNGCCICPQVNGCCIPAQVNGQYVRPL